ncbi:Osmotically-inducible protein OsmY, contains BON domain [Caloramator fervidus]|uniref:Osmotically-inducible protein OsmY, contains BON domain n=1 Tax=Caloramator fervidus TaxID=29344 RepID=A0A1H5TJT8_9CLOT|nr:BON domain-containing protein [Caloramator fervidus]SEF63142.1 Osmotically-inducible protein OsmY, contains BON domain [Caloramator fervidus]
MLENERIENKIKELLEREVKELSLDVNVRYSNGHVTLYGIVDTLSEKLAIENLVSKIDEVKSIENCLTISTDGTLEDKEAEQNVINKLKNHPKLSSLGVEVQRGVAILKGKVDTLKEKRMAMKLASEAFGIKDVVSHIEIDSLYKTDDVTINNRIQTELVNNNLDKNDIRVNVENGSVTLNGFVNSLKDVEIAQEIAEGIEGVRNVKNFLKIRN